MSSMAIQVWMLPFIQCGCALSGLPGGACALAWVPAEERWNREQEAEGPTGGAAESQPPGKEGTGGHSAGASGAAVSDVEIPQCKVEICEIWLLLNNVLHHHVCQDMLDSMWLQPPGQKPFNPFDQPVADARAIQQPRRRQVLPKVWLSVCLSAQLSSKALFHPNILKAETNKRLTFLLK